MSEPSFWTIEEYLANENISEIELHKRLFSGEIDMGCWVNDLPVIHAGTLYLRKENSGYDFNIILGVHSLQSATGLIGLDSRSKNLYSQILKCHEIWLKIDENIIATKFTFLEHEDELFIPKEYEYYYKDIQIKSVVDDLFDEYSLFNGYKIGNTTNQEKLDKLQGLLEALCLPSYPLNCKAVEDYLIKLSADAEDKVTKSGRIAVTAKGERSLIATKRNISKLIQIEMMERREKGMSKPSDAWLTVAPVEDLYGEGFHVTKDELLVLNPSENFDEFSNGMLYLDHISPENNKLPSKTFNSENIKKPIISLSTAYKVIATLTKSHMGIQEFSTQDSIYEKNREVFESIGFSKSAFQKVIPKGKELLDE